MANVDRPRGLECYGEVMRLSPYTAGSAIYPGDPVKLDADGKVDRSAGDALIGVAASYAAADGATVLVYDHPEQLFIIQADDASIDAVTDYGGNFDIALGSADTTYRKSQAELDGDTADAHTEATNPLKLIRKDESVNNEFGANVDCVVKINNHQLGEGAVSAAV